MLTYVHETLHEHTNVAASATRGPEGAMANSIEEAMTDLGARRILREQYGATTPNAMHLAGGPPDLGARAYDGDLARIRRETNTVLERRSRQLGITAPTLGEIDHAMDRACLEYKQRIATGRTAQRPADVVRSFVGALQRHLPPGYNDPPTVAALQYQLVSWRPCPQGTP